MAWCKGPGARKPRLPMPVSQRTTFWDFDFYRILYGSPPWESLLFGFSTFWGQKVPFLGSKNDQKPRFSNPGPNVHQNRSGGSIFFGGGRRRYENFWALVWSFYDKKLPFLGSKNDQKPGFSNPGPNVHRNRDFNILAICPGPGKWAPWGPQGPQRDGAVGGDCYCLGWRLYGVVFIGMGWCNGPVGGCRGGFYWYGVV